MLRKSKHIQGKSFFYFWTIQGKSMCLWTQYYYYATRCDLFWLTQTSRHTSSSPKRDLFLSITFLLRTCMHIHSMIHSHIYVSLALIYKLWWIFFWSNKLWWISRLFQDAELRNYKKIVYLFLRDTLRAATLFWPKATWTLLPSISLFGSLFLSPPPGMNSSLHTLAIDVSFGGFHGRCGRIWSSYRLNLHIVYGFHG